jgi:hypothetical protein
LKAGEMKYIQAEGKVKLEDEKILVET